MTQPCLKMLLLQVLYTSNPLSMLNNAFLISDPHSVALFIPRGGCPGWITGRCMLPAVIHGMIMHPSTL